MPEASALAWVRFARLADAAQAVERLNTSGTRPVAIELMNAPIASRKSAKAGDLPVEDWALVVGFEDNADVGRLAARPPGDRAGRYRLVVLQGEDSHRLWSALVDSQAAEVGSTKIAINLRPSAALGFLPANLRPVGPSSRTRQRDHPSPPDRRGDARRDRRRRDRSAPGRRGEPSAATSPCRECPTAWKDRLRVWGHPRGEWAMAEKVKAALDPGGVLNPGRFVGKI